MQSTYNYTSLSYTNNHIKPIKKVKRYRLNAIILKQRLLALALILLQIASIKLLLDATICLFFIPMTILLLTTKEDLLN